MRTRRINFVLKKISLKSLLIIIILSCNKFINTKYTWLKKHALILNENIYCLLSEKTPVKYKDKDGII